jgi:hypothetical protein
MGGWGGGERDRVEPEGSLPLFVLSHIPEPRETSPPASEFGVHGAWCMVQGFRVHGSWSMVHGAWFMVHDFEVQV